MQTPGRFVRFDLMTTAPAEARAFYAGLFGWTFEQAAGDFAPTMHADGAPVGWLMPMEPGHPSHWIGYVSVADTDAACARVVEAGGQVCVPPMDLPIGRFAVVEDATGAVTSPLAGGAREAPACLAWVQLLTRDAEAAAPLYAAVDGWDAAALEGAAHVFAVEGEPFASIMQKPGGPEEERDAWLPYFKVASVAERTAAARALGGRVFVPPTPLPGMGRFAVLADPTGATFALWEDA